MKIRIATWNIDRGKSVSPILDTLTTVSADLLVFTESSNNVSVLLPYNCINSQEFQRYQGYPWITICTRWEILEQVTTFNPYRTACCIVESPLGPLIVYGTIIPYQMAGVNGNRYPETGKRAWQMHLEDIQLQSEDWKVITQKHPGVPMIVAGDFNQTRDGNGRGYGTSEGRSILSNELMRNNLTCITEEDYRSTRHLKPHPRTGKTRRNIDHICVSTHLVTEFEINTGAWNGFTPEGKLLSDHNGVYADIWSRA